MVMLVMVHYHGTFLMFEDDLLLQDLKYCGYFYPDVIFKYDILLNFCTCDSSLHYIHSSHIVAKVSRFTCNIIVQVK